MFSVFASFPNHAIRKSRPPTVLSGRWSLFPKKHPTIRKNSLRSFLLMRACGNCVSARPYTNIARTISERLLSVRARFICVGCFLQLLFLYQVLHPDAFFYQHETDGAFDDIGALHGEVEGEHRKGGAGCKKVS